MALCKYCNQYIVFGAHPSNPEKVAPFNKDGTIHFATCPRKPGKPKDEYDHIEEIEGAVYVHLMTTAAGDRLRATGNRGEGIKTLAMTQKNLKLINAERDFHRKIIGYRTGDLLPSIGDTTPNDNVDKTNCKKYESGGSTLLVHSIGDGGAHQETTMIFSGDLFGDTRFFSTDDGFGLVIRGSWELDMLSDMIRQAFPSAEEAYEESIRENSDLAKKG